MTYLIDRINPRSGVSTAIGDVTDLTSAFKQGSDALKQAQEAEAAARKAAEQAGLVKKAPTKVSSSSKSSVLLPRIMPNLRPGSTRPTPGVPVFGGGAVEAAAEGSNTMLYAGGAALLLVGLLVLKNRS